MELMEKKGFQQTEVGLIPKDWNVKLLGDIGAPKMCKRIFNYQTKKRGDIPFYKIGTFGKKPDAFIARELYEEYKRKYSFPLNGSVLISAAGTIGRLVVYAGGDEYFQDSNIVWIENDEKLVTNHFLKHVFPSVNFKTEGSTISRLYNNILKSGEFACPGISEQKAIVTALSDVDELITNLDKLIAKKKDIKKGAMQQLLTPPQKGGKRLPGFEGEWVEKTLGEIFDFKTATSKKQFFDLSGDLIVMDMGSVSTEGKILKSKRANCDFDILKRDDLVMPKDDIGGGNIIGKVAYIDKDNSYVLSDHVFKLRPLDDKIDSLYFSYLINSSIVNETILKVVSGSAQLGLGLNIIKHLTVFYNSDNQQQKSIAQILYDMDAEIKSLELKQQKYSNIKQGMMQELLTGKTRII